MIPWFQITTLNIGSVPIYIWGLFVAIGIIVATFVAGKRAKKNGLSEERMWDLSLWAIIGALVGGRLFEIFYQPKYFIEHPLDLIRIWDGGMSMMGGIIGSLLVGVWYLKKHKLKVLDYIEQGFYALPLGIGIGRIGCFLIHDHPGTFTNFFLGVRYLDGVRHDHGLYLSIEGFLLFALFLFIDKKKVPVGTFLILFFVIDGLVRFFLDFFRATDLQVSDIRYFSLTPAQYIAVAMIIIGLVLWKKRSSPKF